MKNKKILIISIVAAVCVAAIVCGIVLGVTLRHKHNYKESVTAPALNAEGTAYDGNYWHEANGEIVIWTKEVK